VKLRIAGRRAAMAEVQREELCRGDVRGLAFRSYRHVKPDHLFKRAAKRRKCRRNCM